MCLPTCVVCHVAFINMLQLLYSTEGSECYLLAVVNLLDKGWRAVAVLGEATVPVYGGTCLDCLYIQLHAQPWPRWQLEVAVYRLPRVVIVNEPRFGFVVVAVILEYKEVWNAGGKLHAYCRGQ